MEVFKIIEKKKGGFAPSVTNPKLRTFFNVTTLKESFS